MNNKSMTFAEYVDSHSDIETLFNEMYWQEGSLDVEKAFTKLLIWAKHEGVEIVDAEECNYDNILYGAWMATEKGFS